MAIAQDPHAEVNTAAQVLLVDDDPDLSALAAAWLSRAGFVVHAATTVADGLSTLAAGGIDLVLLDLALPDMGGLEALPAFAAQQPSVPIVILTGDTRPQTVVTAMKSGARDYMTKPLDRASLVAMARNSTADRMHAPTAAHGADLDYEAALGMWGRSPQMLQMFRQLRRVAETDVTVYIHGETGTGKELAARAVHSASARSAGPFVALNCASIPEQLQESELFGHERGAFTGAHQRHEGRFEQAQNGTLFLDEVAELSLALQAKLLRALQEQTFFRVGGKREIRSDFRLVVATHRDLAEVVRAGSFREDLYYRVAVFELVVPPLRDRQGDVPYIASKLLQRLSVGHGDVVRLSNAALQALGEYEFPGNVRELENVIQRALVVREGDLIQPVDLSRQIRSSAGGARPGTAESPGPVVGGGAVDGGAQTRDSVPTMKTVERDTIVRAIESAGGNLSEVTRRLGIGRTTLYRKLKKYGIR